MSYLYEKREAGIASGTGTVTLEADQACWHNQLIITVVQLLQVH